MTTPPPDNMNVSDDSPGGVAHLMQDLTGRYDDLLEFLLEFTHRQAQWDQRQQQLVDFQRHAIDQLRSTSLDLIERHQQLTTAEPGSYGGSKESSFEGDRIASESLADLAKEHWPKALREKAAELDAYEDDLKQRIFEQKQLTQLTRLQRRKLAQQLRARRAELKQLESTHTESSATASSIPELTTFFAQLQKDLDDERSVSQQSLAALQETLEQTRQEKQSLQQEVKDRVADIDELKRLVVELGQSENTQQRHASDANEEQLIRLENARQEVESRAKELEQLEQKTRLQRQKIAQTLRAQKAERGRSVDDDEEKQNGSLEGIIASIDPDSLQGLQDAVAERLDQQMELIEQRLSSDSDEEDDSGEQHAATTAAIQQLRDELLDQLTNKHDELVERLSESPADVEQVPHWMHELREHITAHHEKAEASLLELEKRLASVGDERADDSRDELKELRAHLRETEADVTRLMDENAELASQVMEARQKSLGDSDAPVEASGGASEELDQLQRELDKALEKNRSLKQQLAETKKADTAPLDDGLDWEAAKRRMLAELEAFDDEEPEQKKERLSIEEVITETDRIISEKNEEIVELKHLLSHQSDSIGDVAVGANAIADLIDHDELIQQERDNLQQLQEEWKEKLRASEVELSLERARLARERAELEERISQLSSDSHSSNEKEEEESTGKGSGSNRGKWLERLGLRDEQE